MKQLHKKRIQRLLLLTAILLFCSIGCKQHNFNNPKTYRDYSRYSYVDSVPVNDSTIENLMVLGKVWGFVKYYHPIFEDSVFNVDYELFELLPKIIPADYDTRNQVLCDWIDSLGAFETDEEYYKEILADTLVRKIVSYKWMEDRSKISNELGNKLNRMIYAKRNGSNVYAGIAKRNGVQGIAYRFSRECPYNLFFLDCGFRLLGLFRYWNMVEYYYSARHLIGCSWDKVLREYIPIFIGSSFQSDYRSACFRLFAEIHDTHTEIFFPSTFFGIKKLPIWIQFIESSWVIISNSNETNGLKQGDCLLSIDGMSVDSIVSKLRPYTSYSNDAVFYRNAARFLQSTSKDSVVLKYKRGIFTYTNTVESTYENPYRYSSPPYIKLKDSIGYICISQYRDTEMKDSVINMLNRINKLIIDLRFGSGHVWDFASYFMRIDRSISLKWLTNTEQMPGIFKLTNNNTRPYSRKNKEFKGKIIVLVSEHTQSNGEACVLTLQTMPHLKTIGNTTAGAGGAISYIALPGDISTAFTSYEFFTPNGIQVQGPGVPIDETVTVTINGIREGRDEVYERALELIKTL